MQISKITLFLVIGLLFSFIGHFGCYSDDPRGGKTNEWRSKFYPIRVTIADHWKVIQPSKDSADGVTVGFIDDSDGCSMVIKVTQDVSKDLLSDETYFSAVRDQMVNHSPENELLDELETQFKNATYYRMRFAMWNKQFEGLFCQSLYVRRTGELSITCQVNHPIQSKTELNLPAKLKELLRELKLFDKLDKETSGIAR